MSKKASPKMTSEADDLVFPFSKLQLDGSDEDAAEKQTAKGTLKTNSGGS